MKLKLETNGGKLTEKDKKLLMLLLVVILVGGLGALVILPLYNKQSETKELIAQEKEQQQLNEEKVMMLESYKQLKGSYEKDLKDLKSGYLPWMESDDIDMMLTEDALNYNLISQYLNIQMPQDMQSLSPYLYSEAYQKMNEMQAATPDSGDTEDTESADTSDMPMLQTSETYTLKDTVSNLYTANVSLTVAGTSGDLQNFLDYLFEQEPKMRVTSFSWSDIGIVDNGVVTDGNSLSIGLELYMTTEE